MAVEQPKTGTVVRCASCGGFALRGAFEGVVEINCTTRRCGAALLVAMRDGQATVKVLRKK